MSVRPYSGQQAAALLLLGIALSACNGGREGVVAGAASLDPRTHDDDSKQPWEQPVRKAICGPDDRPETGLQGQVPLIDRVSGRSQQGYSCNLELVGQWQGDGAGWQHAWYEDCAYYGTTAREGREHDGVVVIDASEPTNPRPSEYLTSPAMIDPWESLKVNERRGLLGAVDGTDGAGSPYFDLYDLKGDCRHPQLEASVLMDNAGGHEGNFASDGLTYYGAYSTYNAFDISNTKNPVQLISWTPPGGYHGLATSPDGMRGYFTTNNIVPATAVTPASNGFVIADTSDVQLRKPDPEIRVISQIAWADGSIGQHPIHIRIAGKPYVVFVDENGSGGLGTPATWQFACANGLPPYGFARLFDVSDETAPKLVAKMMLETHDPANCAQVVGDTTGQVIFGYDSHYCTVDNPDDATVLGCAYFNSGIRVFDIRDPYFPREIAYFNPPAQADKQGQLRGSQHDSFYLTQTGGLLNADWCSAQVRFVPERGELWGTCQDNGFMILKFREGVWPFRD